ncbi:MAG: retroviral-like aspartic protease family protein [Steroidobacteraceae bacterium]
MIRKRLAILPMVAALAACATPQGNGRPAGAANARPAPVLLYSESTRPDDLGRIVVPVILNGEGPFFFMLDTGATRTVIAKQALDRLGLQADPERQVLLRGLSGVKPIPTVLVRSMQAGSMQFNEVRMPVLDAPILEGVDGVIGNDTLGQHRVTADFAADQILIVDTQGAPAAKTHLVVPFTPLSRAPIMVDAIVGGVRARAIIDTGGADTLGNVALLRALRRQVRSNGNYKLIAQIGITDITDTTQQALLMSVKSLTVGPLEFANLRVSFGNYSIFDRWDADDRPTVLIGMDTLGLLSGLVIDFQRKELHIPIATTAAAGS